ncbi:glycosyltransferase [Terriglobus albidus]|nr:glycosyltransferase [Terriglobus albidus]
MPEKLTILFQAPNRVGLGHMNRLANIADRLHSFGEHVYTPFIVQGLTHSFLESRGFDAIAIPAFSTRSKNSLWNSEDTARSFLLSLSELILATHKPDLVVFDSFPSLEFAEATQQADIPMAICIRRVKDFDRYAQDPRVAQVLHASKILIVPHSEDEFTLPEPFQRKTAYVGPIVRELPIDPQPMALPESTLAGKIVVITGGGGGHSSVLAFYNLALDAFRRLSEVESSLTCVLMAGPLFDQWRHLRDIPGVYIRSFSSDSLDIFATANLVITQAGYNTLAELFYLATPSICIPASRGFDDQFARANSYAKTCDYIETYEGASAAELAAKMETLLARSIPRSRPTPPSGALEAAVLLHNIALAHRH